ncbi:hypothetical protein ABT123_35610, partial [Streptomyces sp. NPDC002054]
SSTASTVASSIASSVETEVETEAAAPGAGADPAGGLAALAAAGGPAAGANPAGGPAAEATGPGAGGPAAVADPAGGPALAAGQAAAGPGGALGQGADGVRGEAPVSGRGGVGDQAPQGQDHQLPAFAVDPTAMPAAHNSAWFAAPKAPQAAYEGGYNPQYVEGLEPTPVLPPTGPDDNPQPHPPAEANGMLPGPRAEDERPGVETADEHEFAEAAYKVLRMLIDEHGNFPTPEALDIHLADGYGVTHPRSASLLRRMMPQLRHRYQVEAEAEHIA